MENTALFLKYSSQKKFFLHKVDLSMIIANQAVDHVGSTDNLLLPNIIGHGLDVWPEGSDVGIPEDGVSVPVHGHQPGVAAMIRL